MKEKIPPWSGPHISVERREGIFRKDKPELLVKRGFNFIGNLPYDASLELPSKVADLETARVERDIRTKGLPRKEDKRIVIKNLATLVRGYLQSGFETVLLRGVYNPETKSFGENQENVAVFKRFAVDKFLTDKTPAELIRDGYQFDNNVTLHAWGDDFERVHEDLVPYLKKENQELERYILAKEQQGKSVRLVKGFYNEADKTLDGWVQNVAVFIKSK